jgi:hypothetical protein
MNYHAPSQPLPPELQRLINEPLSEPPALAREHWKPIRQAMERLDRARAQQAGFDAEPVRLGEELTLARQRDQRALGEALAAGQPEPEPKAAAIEAEIERNVQRSAAMTDVILKEQRQVTDLILRNKKKWTTDLQRHVGDAAALYRAALVAVEQARAALTEEVNLGAWLAMFPATGGQLQTAYLAGDDRPVDPLTGRPEPVVAPKRTFSHVLRDLLRDSEQLPHLGPVQPTREAVRKMDRKQLVVQTADAEGNTRPQVLKGDTHAGWLVRDALRLK